MQNKGAEQEPHPGPSLALGLLLAYHQQLPGTRGSHIK